MIKFEKMKVPMLGIEVRKIGTMDGLYKEVDMVLNKTAGFELQRQTVAHAIQKMLRDDNHFSVCTIDRCSAVCGIIIPIERQRIYSAIHCMDWNKMLPEYRQTIVAMILDDFRGVLNPTP